MPKTKENVRNLYALAARLGIGMGEACDRINMARSTPSRWKNGTTPRPQQLARMRRAILEVAVERGIIPGAEIDGGSYDVVNRDAMLSALAAARDVVTRLEIGLGIRSDR